MNAHHNGYMERNRTVFARDFLSEAARPRLVALTARPERLLGRAVPFRMFDEVVGKLDGLPAVVDAIKRQLRSSPDRAARCAVQSAAQQI